MNKTQLTAFSDSLLKASENVSNTTELMTVALATEAFFNRDWTSNYSDHDKWRLKLSQKISELSKFPETMLFRNDAFICVQEDIKTAISRLTYHFKEHLEHTPTN